MSKPIISRFSTVLLCTLLALLTGKSHAQKYIFTHYDIEDGLIQSQVTRITEDKNHRIWIGTMGGACRFDGKEFTSLTKEHGLNSNFIFSVLTDAKGQLWVGTRAGLSVYYKREVVNYTIPASIKRHTVAQIAQDAAGITWLLMNNQLCTTKGSTVQPAAMPESLKNTVTAMATSASGHLYIVVYNKGVYKRVNKRWLPVTLFNASTCHQVFKRILFNRANPEQFFLLAEDAVYIFRNNRLTLYEPALLRNKRAFICMQQDKDFNLWLGTDSGAYRLSKGRLTHFNAGNGFSDQQVMDIYNDSNNNLWFGVGASGLYKYEGDEYLTYNNLPGQQSNIIIMGFAKHPDGSLLLGTGGFGVLKYNGKDPVPFWTGPANTMSRFVQNMHTDKKGNVWIGTSQSGLWKYDGKRVRLVPGTKSKTISAIASNTDGTLWFTTPGSVFYLQNDELYTVKNLHTYAASILPISPDSILVGGLDGLRLIVNKKYDPVFNMPEINSSSIYCMMRYGKYLLLGTGDRGIIMVDIKTRKYKRYTAADGLNSDIIYSITADKYGYVWLGTGRGVNKLSVNTREMTCQVVEITTYKGKIAEANQNAIFYHNEHIYIGNTIGLSIYKCSKKENVEGRPHLIMQSVKVFENQQEAIPEAGIPPVVRRSLADELILNYNQNHIKINYLGIYLRNPASVYYQYKLAGMDSSFSQPVTITEVDYPSLPPGKYTFVVKVGITRKMLVAETLTYSFTIKPPFYQTFTFRILAVFLLIWAGVGIQYYYTRQKVRRTEAMEVIRMQEKLAIRRQTAEDFHDDLGNKLTRISVLSDILSTKLQGEAEQQNLVKQIKQNVDALYKGTKDILWALDPKSDNLYEILLHVKDFGRELFEDTATDFQFNGVVEKLAKVKLPMEYCRNLTMICKEVLNNMLKHANATQVLMEVELVGTNQVKLVFKDNGKGFNTDLAHTGRGLGNINKRVKRINGHLRTMSMHGAGTTIQLEFSVPNSNPA